MSNTCPNCKATLKNRDFAPFCSERCKLLDLGKWLREEYRVPEKETSTVQNKDSEEN